jgi:hypothetical protein
MRSASEIESRQPARIKSSCLSAAFSLPAADRTRRGFALPALFFDSGAVRHCDHAQAGGAGGAVAALVRIAISARCDSVERP